MPKKTGRLARRRNRSSTFDETLNKAEYDNEKREQELGNKQKKYIKFQIDPITIYQWSDVRGRFVNTLKEIAGFQRNRCRKM